MKVSLAFLLFKSIGAGYSALNIVLREKNIEKLEFSPLGTRAHIILKGTKEDLNNYISMLRTSDIERSLVVDEVPEIILKSYLSLEYSPIKNFLLIYEANFIGDLFQFAKEFSLLNLAIVDFRVQRMENSPGYLIMTGDNPELAKSKSQQMKRTGQLITFIPNLSENLKEYFD